MARERRSSRFVPHNFVRRRVVRSARSLAYDTKNMRVNAEHRRRSGGGGGDGGGEPSVKSRSICIRAMRGGDGGGANEEDAREENSYVRRLSFIRSKRRRWRQTTARVRARAPRRHDIASGAYGATPSDDDNGDDDRGGRHSQRVSARIDVAARRRVANKKAQRDRRESCQVGQVESARLKATIEAALVVVVAAVVAVETMRARTRILSCRWRARKNSRRHIECAPIGVTQKRRWRLKSDWRRQRRRRASKAIIMTHNDDG